MSKVARRHLPGVEGIWFFIVFDMCFFALLFLSFVQSESGHAAVFAATQKTLNTNLGLTNTVVLLTSSWFVVLGVQAARREARRPALWFLVLAVLCGVIFLGVKGFEYAEKFRAGISLTTNNFYMFYFIVTFIHALHVILGLAALTVMVRKTSRPAPLSGNLVWLESAGLFWHTVDLLWVMIFALLYLVSWR